MEDGRAPCRRTPLVPGLETLGPLGQQVANFLEKHF
jgi:hypothetical protein